MRAIAITFALLLAGCSEVVSDTPLLIEADAKGAPALRDGVWRLVEPTCKYRENLASHSWPDCAVWGVLKGRDAQMFQGWARGGWTSGAVMVSGGDPAIVQVRSELSYGYFALRPTGVDASGQVIEVRAWPILCGPRQEPAAHPQRPRVSGLGVRDGLFEAMEPDGALRCHAASVEPLRAAAKVSEALVEPASLKWVAAQPR